MTTIRRKTEDIQNRPWGSFKYENCSIKNEKKNTQDNIYSRLDIVAEMCNGCEDIARKTIQNRAHGKNANNKNNKINKNKIKTKKYRPVTCETITQSNLFVVGILKKFLSKKEI